MIELRVEPYCEDCPHFEATSYTYTDRKVINGSAIRTIVYCKDRSKCDVIAEHIERKMANDDLC